MACVGWSAVAEDWSAAIDEQPDGMGFLGRGIAHWLAGKSDLAVQDLEHALTLGLVNRGDAEQVLAQVRAQLEST